MQRNKQQNALVAPISTTTGVGNRIAYSGKVTIYQMYGNQKKVKKVIHNAGYSSLWKFLATTLAGGYTAAETIRPCKIKIFTLSTKSQTFKPSTAVTDLENNGGTAFIDNFTQLTSFILTNSAASITSDTTQNVNGENVDSGFTTTLHFSIPASQFTGATSNATSVKIYMMALYGKNKSTSTDNGDFSAYYLLEKEDGNWDPLDLTIGSATNLYVDWALSIANK